VRLLFDLPSSCSGLLKHAAARVGLLCYRLLQQAAGTDPRSLSELIGGTGNDWDKFTNN
jgi:hypothetical protein